MKDIPIQNEYLKELLNNISDYAAELHADPLYEVRKEHPNDPRENIKDLLELNDLDFTSMEYLQKAMEIEKKCTGTFEYPRASKVAGREWYYSGILTDKRSKEVMSKYGGKFANGQTLDEAVKTIRKHTRKLSRYLGAQHSALFSIYPPYGGVGWHTNSNASGLNVLFSYNPTGEGWFKIRDRETGEIVTYPDHKGWFVKVGYFSPVTDRDNVENQDWHCCWNGDCLRVSVAYIFKDDQRMWEQLEDIITGKDRS